MFNVSVPSIVEVYLAEPHGDDYVAPVAVINEITARIEKRIPAHIIEEALSWIANTPIKDPSGKTDKQYHWSMYCVSGYSMPPHPWVPNRLHESVEKLLWTIFSWVCFAEFTRSVPRPMSFGKMRQLYRESIGL